MAVPILRIEFPSTEMPILSPSSSRRIVRIAGVIARLNRGDRSPHRPAPSQPQPRPLLDGPSAGHRGNILGLTSTLEMLRARPLVGVGPGMFPEHLPVFLNRARAKSAYAAAGHGYDVQIDPHSTYLGWGAETGLLGLAALLYFLFALIRLTLRLNNGKGGASHPPKVCLIAGVIGFLVNGFQIDILTMRHFWVMIALASVYYQFTCHGGASPGVTPIVRGAVP